MTDTGNGEYMESLRKAVDKGLADKCGRCGQKHDPEAAYSCSRCLAIVCGTQLYMGNRHGFVPNGHVRSQDENTVFHQAFADMNGEMIPFDCGPIHIGDTEADPLRSRLWKEREEKEEEIKKQINVVKGAMLTQNQKTTLAAVQQAARRPRRA